VAAPAPAAVRALPALVGRHEVDPIVAVEPPTGDGMCRHGVSLSLHHDIS